MKIRLQKNWDNLPSGNNKPSPYFSGRKKEAQLIKHIILNNSSGSILVGAFRGTGKTDLIYKSLTDAINEGHKSNLTVIPIVFNATHLITENGNEKDKSDNKAQEILKNLIARTYAACKDVIPEDLVPEISKLYLQSRAQKYEEQIKESADKSVAKEIVDQKETIRFLNFSISKTEIEEIIKTYMPLGLLSLAFMFKDLPPYLSIPLYIVLFILSIFSLTNFKIGLDKTNKKTDTNTKKNIISQSAELSYLTDNSFGNLEFGLKEFLQKINLLNTYKLVFVIDELDKVTASPENKVDLIKVFKSLFNHADALFFFVVDEIVYAQVNAARVERNPNSTLFSQRIFINRPKVSDIKSYIDLIIISTKKTQFEDFKDAVIYSSKMDFYRISDSLRDLSLDFEDDYPVIEWNDIPVNIQKSNKQKIITMLLEEGGYLYKEQSNLYLNEALIDSAYLLTDSSDPVEVPASTDSPEYPPTIEERTKFQLKLDLGKYLNFAGIFTKVVTSKEDRTYFIYTPTAEPGKPIISLTELLEFEKEYLRIFQDFEMFILQVHNFWSGSVDLDETNIVDLHVLLEIERITGLSKEAYPKYQKISDSFNSDPSKHEYSQEEIRTQIEEMTTYQTNILGNVLNIIYTVIKEISLTIGDVSLEDELMNNFLQYKDYIINNSIQNILIKDADKDQLAIFVLNPPDTIANSETLLGELRNNKHIRIIEIFTDNRKLPKISDKQVIAHTLNKLGLKGFDIIPQDLKHFLKGFSFIN